MDRIDYDPEGGNYQPVTEHETGSTFMVVGLVMLVAALGWGLFVGWDMKAGGMLMQTIFTVDVALALFLIILGFIKKKRQTN
jgi:hypothetical protein